MITPGQDLQLRGALTVAPHAPHPVAPSEPLPAWQQQLRATVAGLIVAVVAVNVWIGLTDGDRFPLARYFFLRQDMMILIAGAAGLAIVLMLGPKPWLERIASELLGWPARTRDMLTVGTLAVALAGTFLVAVDYPLTRDELMAAFDAQILRSGRLMAPIAPEWRTFAHALLPEFGLPVAGNAAWVSAYLPVNAAMRAALSLIGLPQLLNPLLAALAVWSVHGVARRLWPERPDAAVIAVLVMATSTQALTMAMTSYAMTAHLAFNMLWLRLFLRDDRSGHAGALGIGFLACGLHQIVFHPLFAAPFVLQLWWGRRWRLAAMYTCAYAAFGLAWISYAGFSAAASGVELARLGGSGPQVLLATLMQLLGSLSVQSLELLPLNLLRFLAWHSPLLLPLLVLTTAGRPPRLPAPLIAGLAGIALTLVVVSLLMPYQGHGWGYRYLHGFIGIGCLLAAWGWVCLADRCEPRDLPAVRSLVGAGIAFFLLVQLPVQALAMRRFTQGHATASAILATAAADVVVIDNLGLFFADDLVRNDPFLQARPKLMALALLDEARIRRLCAGHSVAYFGQAHGAAAGILTYDRSLDAATAARLDAKRALMASLGCGQPLPIVRP